MAYGRLELFPTASLRPGVRVQPTGAEVKGAAEHATFVVSRNLARENPLSRLHARAPRLQTLKHKDWFIGSMGNWSMRLRFKSRPPRPRTSSRNRMLAATTPSKQSRRPKFIISGRSISEKDGAWVSTKV